MNELIKVKTKEDMQIVSARDLHEVLGVKTRFSQWAKQNFKHFRKGIDFEGVVVTTPFNPNYPDGKKQELQDYALTIEMAKHIAMMSGTDKGYEIRDYFIKVEQAWNSPEMVMKRALEIANKKVEQLKLENKKMQPKALFADSVAASHTTILIGELAKILRGNGINIGANRLFQWMRDKGYLISRKGTDYNMPTQRSMNLGLFKIKESTITHSNGSVSISKTTKVTGKGQQYFINKFMKMNETAIG
ncbi:phage antirepressor KilAC domain-containing protein [Ligilactobacillus salivarius]|uniref:phage antirepressor KilAC domain-containing protein n=1 Tax=Ligilactobacillus salivarius TaxID=1624 RepID=UPI0016523A02|nr:phage antirepressor KilAC domain-containing protein [Ligilactobacillus salivarius]MBC6925139.1 oxidoreductase [Ligilactobacillus salivarius]